MPRGVVKHRFRRFASLQSCAERQRLLPAVHFASRHWKGVKETFLPPLTPTFILHSRHAFGRHIKKREPGAIGCCCFFFISSPSSLMMMGSRGAATGTFHQPVRPWLLWSLLIVAATVWYAQLSQQLPCSLETSHHINPGGQPPPTSPFCLPFNECFSLHPLSASFFFVHEQLGFNCVVIS